MLIPLKIQKLWYDLAARHGFVFQEECQISKGDISLEITLKLFTAKGRSTSGLIHAYWLKIKIRLDHDLEIPLGKKQKDFSKIGIDFEFVEKYSMEFYKVNVGSLEIISSCYVDDKVLLDELICDLQKIKTVYL